MDMSVLFEHLDRVEQREAPLTPIYRELEGNTRYTPANQSCPVEDCSGDLWEHDGTMFCGTCSAIKDKESGPTVTTPNDRWTHFQTERPRYRNSNRRRAVGGFPTYEWVESDDVDGSVRDLEADAFYEP